MLLAICCCLLVTGTMFEESWRWQPNICFGQAEHTACSRVAGVEPPDQLPLAAKLLKLIPAAKHEKYIAAFGSQTKAPLPGY